MYLNKDYCQTFAVYQMMISCFNRTVRLHTVHATLSLTCAPMCPMCSHVPEFIEPENWPRNSPDLNPVDYSVWGAMQQMVYRHKISDIDELKCVLIDCWAQLSQDMLNRAIDQLPKRLMMVIQGKGAHVEYCLD